MVTKACRFSSPWWSPPCSRRRSLQLWGANSIKETEMKWPTYHKLSMWVIFDIVWTPDKKKKSIQTWSRLLHLTCFPSTQTYTAPSSFCFHLENGFLHPQSGARLTPALWGCRGLFGRMWTQCPVSYRRGWPETYWILGAEPGALGQAHKPYEAGAETFPRTEAGSPEHRRQPSPLGCWGGDGAGRAGSICRVAISLTPLWLPSGEVPNFFLCGKIHLT